MICKFCNHPMQRTKSDVFFCKNHQDCIVIYDNQSKPYEFWSIAKDGYEIGNLPDNFNSIIIFTHFKNKNFSFSTDEELSLNGFSYGNSINDKGTILNLPHVSLSNIDSHLKRIKLLLPFL